MPYFRLKLALPSAVEASKQYGDFASQLSLHDSRVVSFADNTEDLIIDIGRMIAKDAVTMANRRLDHEQRIDYGVDNDTYQVHLARDVAVMGLSILRDFYFESVEVMSNEALCKTLDRAVPLFDDIDGVISDFRKAYMGNGGDFRLFTDWASEYQRFAHELKREATDMLRRWGGDKEDDAVFCTRVLAHIERVEKHLAKIKISGEFVKDVPTVEQMAEEVKEVMLLQLGQRLASGNYYLYDEKSLEPMVEDLNSRAQRGALRAEYGQESVVTEGDQDDRMKRYGQVKEDRVCASITSVRLDREKKAIVGTYKPFGPLAKLLTEVPEPEVAFSIRGIVERTRDETEGAISHLKEVITFDAVDPKKGE